MGGEDLKKFACVLILFAIGLSSLTTVISAQESDTLPVEEVSSHTQDSYDAQVSETEASEPPVVNPPRAGHLRETEQAYSFGRDNNTAASASGSSVWTIIRMILALALVAVAIYGLVYFLKKKTAAKDTEKDPYLRLLAQTHLGNNRYAQILSVGSRAWLVGSTDGGINLISEIEDKEIIDAMQMEDSKKAALTPAGGFLDFFSMLRRSGAKVDDSNPSTDEIRKRRERLKDL